MQVFSTTRSDRISLLLADHPKRVVSLFFPFVHGGVGVGGNGVIESAKKTERSDELFELLPNAQSLLTQTVISKDQ